MFTFQTFSSIPNAKCELVLASLSEFPVETAPALGHLAKKWQVRRISELEPLRKHLQSTDFLSTQPQLVTSPFYWHRRCPKVLTKICW